MGIDEQGVCNVEAGMISLRARREPILANRRLAFDDPAMSTLTIALPDALDAMLAERVQTAGAGSKEEYLVALVESDCAASALEETLAARLDGPFAPLEPDWKERVR